MNDLRPDSENFLADKMSKVETTNAADAVGVDDSLSCFLEPLGARVIIQEDPFKEPSKFIKTPDSAKRRPTTGTIVSVGTDVINGLKAGDRVLFGNFSGTLVQFRGRPAFRILGEDEILAKVTKTDVQLEETK